MRTYPVNRVLGRNLNQKVHQIALALVEKSGLEAPDFKTVVTANQRGYCFVNIPADRYLIKGNLIVIPFFAWTRSKQKEWEGFLEYYVAHELAHLISVFFFEQPGHGETFLRFFQILCPEEYQHWEGQYTK